VADTGQERTEEASERKIQRAREEGRVASAKELVAAGCLVGGIGGAVALAGEWSRAIASLMRLAHAHVGQAELGASGVVELLAAVAAAVALPLLGTLAAAWAMVALVGMSATTFNVTWRALEWKLDRFDVFATAKSLWFGATPWVALAKGLAVAGLMSWAAWSTVRAHMAALPLLALGDVHGQIAYVGTVLVDLLKRALPVAVAVGAADHLWQRWKYSDELKMSKQEQKEEHKEQDGDPLLKQRRRARQRQLAMGGMLKSVKRADVVVVNPTHYAVALRYRKDEAAAPIVVARGVDHLALKIRQEASRAEVAIVENRPLARALYAQSKLGCAIPKELFGPVAQILAMVYRRRRAA
jgi:flagellar biosynthetic protein FlhB